MKVLKPAETRAETTDKPLFTAPVTMQTLVGPEQSRRFAVRQVNFPKGVRNKFHSHTIEQVLIVTAGKGIVATDREEIVVTVGDVIFIPAGERHWHGATADSAFSHLYLMAPESRTEQLED